MNMTISSRCNHHHHVSSSSNTTLPRLPPAATKARGEPAVFQGISGAIDARSTPPHDHAMPLRSRRCARVFSSVADTLCETGLHYHYYADDDYYLW